ncbi:hypothetical protein RI103_18255 [Paraburkholderia sp. FT54]|uniref:hypothetical protein n=1 Tax=Paraburkholderia sp. FT54 TaxID=3074437 RepID=UPI00287778AE|nr:hypothetical protein [Paraburkholderia sp. FT54]WNC91781.1 hypothetical protein RI103_18255 [Paraburkholderia sp. FT54]
MRSSQEIRTHALPAKLFSRISVAGEFKTRRIEEFHAVRESAASLARQVLRETGYSNADTGIAPDQCEVQIRFNGQSQDINQGVDRADGVLGDQIAGADQSGTGANAPAAT